jgi:hypothetical protein
MKGRRTMEDRDNPGTNEGSAMKPSTTVHWLSIVFGSIGAAAAVVAITWYFFALFEGQDFEILERHQIDISAVVAPFVAGAAAFLSFAAFATQIATNRTQQYQIAKQEEEIREERRRSTYHQLEDQVFRILELRQNTLDRFVVAELGPPMKIVHEERRGAAIRYLVSKVDSIVSSFYAVNTNNPATPSLHVPEHLRKPATLAAYTAIYIGTRFLIDTKQHGQLLPGFLKDTATSQNSIVDHSLDELTSINGAREGFREFLSPYFRQLFQAYRLLSDYQKNGGSAEHASSLARMIRSSTSPAEQTLLYFNLLYGFDDAWEELGIITRYHPLKNMIVRGMSFYPPHDWLMEMGVPSEEMGDHLEDFGPVADPFIRKDGGDV